MNYEDIKKLMEDMGNSKLDSLDIEFPEGIKISMKKDKEEAKVVPQESVVNIQESRQTQITSNIQETKEELQVITSPMVGTFYESATPDKPAFVKVGDKVKKGDVLCIVEAMKLMNEIESEFDGEIVEICVKNQDMVEYGKPLFKIK